MGMFDMVSSQFFGERPTYQTPKTYIGAEDLDRLINLSRSTGQQAIMDQLKQSQQQGTEFMGAQGLAGTGGIPGQMWGNIQRGATTDLSNLELGLSQQRLGGLFQLQQMANQQAATKFQANMASYEANPMFDLLDIGGMFGLNKFGFGK